MSLSGLKILANRNLGEQQGARERKSTIRLKSDLAGSLLTQGWWCLSLAPNVPNGLTRG